MRKTKFQYRVGGFDGDKGYHRNFFAVSDFEYSSYEEALSAGKRFAKNYRPRIYRPQVVIRRESVVYPPKYAAHKLAQAQLQELASRLRGEKAASHKEPH